MGDGGDNLEVYWCLMNVKRTCNAEVDKFIFNIVCMESKYKGRTCGAIDTRQVKVCAATRPPVTYNCSITGRVNQLATSRYKCKRCRIKITY